jgi:predicted Zn-dependent protease
MKFLRKLLLAIFLDVLIIVSGCSIFWYYWSKESIENKVYKMYDKINAQTGQVQDSVPLLIVDSPEKNAYNNGIFIVMYTGFINDASWDEIAMVLGHEIAHGMLGHLNAQMPVPQNNNLTAMGTNGFIAVLEGNADKLGAIYMMKAGYDICKGREIFKRWKEEKGNYLAQNHPDYSYRYDELNINCGDK